MTADSPAAGIDHHAKRVDGDDSGRGQESVREFLETARVPHTLPQLVCGFDRPAYPLLAVHRQIPAGHV